MTIAFNEIPANVLVPNVYIEIDNTQANQGPSIQPYKILLIGQRLTAGTKPEGELVQIVDASQARQYFGAGSQLAQMCAKAREVNKATQLWAVALDDDGSGVKADGTVTFTGTPTDVGVVYLYVGGRRYTASVLTTDTPTTIAAALVSAINADADRVVQASNTAGVLELEARNAGSAGNEIDIRLNYFSDEELPAGISAAVAAMSSGAVNPDITIAFAALTEDQFNIISMPYTDSANLVALDNEMDDRYGPIRQNFGVTFLGLRGSFSDLTTFASPKNSKNYSVMGVKGPNSPWEWAAQIAGRVALAAQIDPARPFQTLTLPTLLAPSQDELFTWTERQNLLEEGVSTFNVVGGTVTIERLRTTYKLNNFGAVDPSFSDVNPILTLEYLRYDFKNQFKLTYPRAKLANDGTNFGAGQNQVIVTPKTAKAFCVQLFRQWEFLGLVENLDQFKNDLIVERNVSDPNRLDILLPPDLINQLRITAVSLQFRL